MFIFIVQYTENEQLVFGVFRLEKEAQWDRFLVAKQLEHLAGYLVTGTESAKNIPFYQKREFVRQAKDEELIVGEEGHLQFLQLLQETAVEYSDDRLKDWSRRRNRMTDANTPAAPATGTTAASLAAAGAPAAGAPATGAPATGAAPAAAAPKAPRNRFTLDGAKKIHLKVTENPRRKATNTYEIFKLYKEGMTVDEALKAGVRMIDIKADLERGHIEVT
ncbi:hypothetical protein EHM76_04820 [bacterium]|nr:MAG: hypothetical protein EHM76_04820 [bacterium]